MNVTLPNGHVITDVPEDATKEQVKAKAIAAGIATPEDFGEQAQASRPARQYQDEGSDIPQIGADGKQLSYAPRTAASAPTFGERAKAAGETALALGTGATTGTLGMLAGTIQGIGQSVLSGKYGTQEGADLAAQKAADVAGSLTYSPRSKLGQEYTSNVAEVAAPLAAVSPATTELSVISRTAPAAARQVSKMPEAVIAKSAEKTISAEAAPTIDALKEASRNIYKEIDNTGAVVAKDRIQSLSGDIAATVKAEGYNRRMHPAINATLQELNDAAKSNQPITNIDTLRKVANNAAGSIDKSEARLGKIVVNKIDGFLDNLDENSLIKGNAEDIGSKYKDARQLWQRATKAELVDNAISKAKNQASGFENGLRTQFRSILNSDRKIKSFTPEERAAMEKVVQGGGIENIAKYIGKLGFGEGQASNMLLGSLGVAGGAAAGGPIGGAAVPLIGQVSRNLAQKLTRNNAEMVSQIVRSGKDATGITRAYLAATPAKERSALELTELLLKTGAKDKINIKADDPSLKMILSDTDYLLGLAAAQEAAKNNQEEKQ